MIAGTAAGRVTIVVVDIVFPPAAILHLFGLP